MAGESQSTGRPERGVPRLSSSGQQNGRSALGARPPARRPSLSPTPCATRGSQTGAPWPPTYEPVYRGAAHDRVIPGPRCGAGPPASRSQRESGVRCRPHCFDECLVVTVVVGDPGLDLLRTVRGPADVPQDLTSTVKSPGDLIRRTATRQPETATRAPHRSGSDRQCVGSRGRDRARLAVLRLSPQPSLRR